MVLSAAKRGFILGYTAGRSNGISIVAQSELAHVSNDADLNKQCGFQQQDIVTMIEEKDHGETGQKFGVLEWS